MVLKHNTDSLIRYQGHLLYGRITQVRCGDGNLADINGRTGSDTKPLRDGRAIGSRRQTDCAPRRKRRGLREVEDSAGDIFPGHGIPFRHSDKTVARRIRNRLVPIHAVDLVHLNLDRPRRRVERIPFRRLRLRQRVDARLILQPRYVFGGCHHNFFHFSIRISQIEFGTRQPRSGRRIHLLDAETAVVLLRRLPTHAKQVRNEVAFIRIAHIPVAIIPVRIDPSRAAHRTHRNEIARIRIVIRDF